MIYFTVSLGVLGHLDLHPRVHHQEVLELLPGPQVLASVGLGIRAN